MKTISKRQYEFLRETLEEQVTHKVMTEEAKTAVLAAYDVRDGLNFIRILVAIGGILIGLGFLTFIATNWNLFDRWVKLFILVGSLSVALGSSYYTYQKNRLTSMALLYVGVLIYGAAIFLMDQIFFINVNVSTGFLVWSIGALVLSSVHKDIILYSFANILAVIYISSSFNQMIILQAIVLLAIFALTNPVYGYRRLLTFGFVALAEIFVLYLFAYYRSDALYPALTFFAIGNGLYYFAPKIQLLEWSKSMLAFTGLLTLVASGFVLTFPDLYNDAGLSISWISWVFAIGLIGYLLYLTSLRLVTPLLGIAVIIARYYFDTFYDTIDRSLFFVLGGLMILGFGYYIETMRRRGIQDASME